MKRIIAVLLSFVIIFGALPFGTYADERDELEGYKKHIYEALINCEEKIELEEFDVPASDVNEFFADIIWDYPEVGCNVTVNEEGNYEFKLYSYSNSGKAAYAEVKYNLNKEQYKAEIEKVDNDIAPILFKIRKMNDFEKALYIHDWICINFMYDYRLFEGNHNENHDVIGFFSDKMGVCQSYAYTYMYMLRKAGVEAHYVISDTDAHGWNVVKIDGKWYHVDVTHDDPIIGETYHYDYRGEVKHTNFLLSDSQIISDGKHDNFYIPMDRDKSIVCGEYTGNSSWREAGSSVLKIGEYWYYLDSSSDAGGLMKTEDFKNVERVMEIGYHYVKEEQGIDLYGWRIGNSFYGGYFSGLFEYNEHLFFNDENNIYAYDTHHNEINKVPVERPEALHYFGLNMVDKTLYYLTSDSNIKTNVDVDGSYTLGAHIPTDWEIIKEATETEEGERVKRCYICGDVIERQSIPALGSYKIGDLDGDDNVNTTDLAGMKLYLAGVLKDINVMAADLNADQDVNTSDLATLKLFLAGVIEF